MANRDISPSAWTAPGSSLLGLLISMSANGGEPLPLDQIINNYSPSIDCTVTTANNTFETIESLVPGLDTNARVIVIILPRGNTTTCTLKGITGDTGIPINPNGFAVIPLTTAAATWGIVTPSGAITGVRILIF